jgi:hypothetical protein
MKNKNSILVLHSCGNAFKLSNDGELLCTPIFSDDSYDKNNFFP